MSLLSFWRFSQVSSSLNDVSTIIIETSADINTSYATSYTWTLAETVLTGLVICMWFSGLFRLFFIIGSVFIFAILTYTQAGARVVHFVAWHLPEKQRISETDLYFLF